MPANTLKILRELNDYKQSYIAEEILGIAPNTYSRLEQNPGKLTADQLKKLASLYKISIENLLSDNEIVITFSEKDNKNAYKKNGIIIRNNTKEDNQIIQYLKEEHDYLLKLRNHLLELNMELKKMLKIE